MLIVDFFSLFIHISFKTQLMTRWNYIEYSECCDVCQCEFPLIFEGKLDIKCVQSHFLIMSQMDFCELTFQVGNLAAIMYFWVDKLRNIWIVSRIESRRGMKTVQKVSVFVHVLLFLHSLISFTILCCVIKYISPYHEKFISWK